MIYRHAGVKLTGIENLKGSREGETALVLCSGTSLKTYDDTIAPAEWSRFAINEGLSKIPNTADFWVLSDDPIVLEYSRFVEPVTTVLAMHQATERIGKFCKTAKEIRTVESMAKIRNYDNGFEFFSRGTVMIGAIEMARYMGFKRFFVFGCDCYRKLNEYYHDGRNPVPLSEKNFDERQLVRTEEALPREDKPYVTARLRRMIEKLDDVVASGLWDDIELFCVNSPYSQQNAMPKISMDEFREIVRSEAEPPSAEDSEPNQNTPSSSGPDSSAATSVDAPLEGEETVAAGDSETQKVNPEEELWNPQNSEAK